MLFRSPPPSDILWENYGTTPRRRFLVFLAVNIPLIFLTSLIIIPIAILNEIKMIFCLIEGDDNFEINAPRWINILIDNYGTPLLMCLNASLIVPLLIHYVANHEKTECKSQLEKSILLKYIVYMIFNIIILPSFGIDTIYKLFINTHWYLYTYIIG